MTTASPIPGREPAYLDLGRGFKWYVVEEEHAVRGGPFETEAEAQAAIKAWHEKMGALYDAVERRAREEGVTVAWSR